jgi:hypothetical protein
MTCRMSLRGMLPRDRGVHVWRQPALWLDAGELLHLVSGRAAQVLREDRATKVRLESAESNLLSSARRQRSIARIQPASPKKSADSGPERVCK